MSDSPASERRLGGGSTQASASSLLSLLPDDVLDKCCSFVGPGHYRYVAGTCHRFRRVYGRKEDKNKTENEKTTWKSGVASVPCAELCLKDHSHHEPPRLTGREVLEVIMLNAAEMGKPELLDWALRHDPCQGLDWKPIFQAATRHGHVNVLEWGVTNNLDLSLFDVAQGAAFHGQVPVLDYIWKQERFPQHCCCENLAAAGGHIDVLEWMKDHGLLPAGRNNCFYAMYKAACNGHVHVLDWFHENGYEPDDDYCVARGGAAGGHINVLEWAQSHSIEWNSEMCTVAAENGHLQALQWLRANGCPWDGNVLRWAQERGLHQAIVEWARDNGCPMR